MKRKYWLIAMSLLAGICCIAGFIAYKFIQSRPPSRLSDCGYYVRGSKAYYHPGFEIAEPFVITGANPKSFVILNVDFQCSADATHAYYQSDFIPNFDPAAIPASAVVMNCDAAGIYFSQ